MKASGNAEARRGDRAGTLLENVRAGKIFILRSKSRSPQSLVPLNSRRVARIK
jgi:hypothetical protein